MPIWRGVSLSVCISVCPSACLSACLRCTTCCCCCCCWPLLASCKFTGHKTSKLIKLTERDVVDDIGRLMLTLMRLPQAWPDNHSEPAHTDSQTDKPRDRQTDGQRDRQRNSSSYKLEAVSHCAASICGCSSTWSCLVSRYATRHKSTLATSVCVCVCVKYMCVCVWSVPVCLSLSVFGMCPKFLESEALTWQLEMPARDKHQTTATTTTTMTATTTAAIAAAATLLVACVEHEKPF